MQNLLMKLIYKCNRRRTSFNRQCLNNLEELYDMVVQDFENIPVAPNADYNEAQDVEQGSLCLTEG